MSANDAYLDLIRKILSNESRRVSPRGLGTLELCPHTTRVNMNLPLVTIKERELDYEFMAAEAYWILSGDRHLNHPALVRNLKKYSDDLVSMRGAYGPHFQSQIEYCVNTLALDPDSRQAVMTIWERNPRPSKDVPCTIAVQFLIRRSLICVNVFMRSSDVWLGWPYDVFTFSMMGLYLRTRMHQKYMVGDLTIIAGSQHLYDERARSAQDLLDLPSHGDILTIDTQRFNNPDDLMIALDEVRYAHKPIEMMKIKLCQ